MKAFRFGGPGTSLELVDLPIPEPSEGQLLISVQAAGLCHSDVHMLKGHHIPPTVPVTLGHEVAGTVAKLGPGPSPFKVGDRVAIGLVSQPPELHSWATAVGLGYDGGYAEYALAYHEHLVKIPDGVTFPQAAVATDSIATAYHAVLSKAGVVEGMTVGITGLGGLGLNGVAVAALQGAKVYGVDIDESKYETAKEFGAIECARSYDAFSGVVFDAVVDFVGLAKTVAADCATVKSGGTVVLVGGADVDFQLSFEDFIKRNITLKGSLGASKEDLENILAMIEMGKLVPKVTEIPFEQIPKGLEDLDAQKVDGRLFARPSRE